MVLVVMAAVLAPEISMGESMSMLMLAAITIAAR